MARKLAICATTVGCVLLVVFWVPGTLTCVLHTAPGIAGNLHLSRLLSPSLVRYYRFDGRSDSGSSDNLCGWTGALIASEGGLGLELVQGSDNSLRAVRLDETPLEADPIQLFSGGTIELRFRSLGPGNQPGPNVAQSATLAACGDGVWSGFRFCIHYPCNQLTFELGPPKPMGSILVASRLRIPPEAWIHATATWDRQHVRLYVNGLLVGLTAYDGPWYPVKSHSRLRLGFVGNGYGSTRFDTEEFLIWNRVLSPQEVLQSGLRLNSQTADQQASLIAAAEFLNAGNAAAAEQALGRFHAIDDAPVLHDAATFLEAEASRILGHRSLAEQGYQQLNLTSSQTPFSEIAHHQLLCLQHGVSGLDTGAGLCTQDLQYDTALDQYRRQRDAERVSQWMQTWEQSVRPIVQSHCGGCHHDDQQELPDFTSISDGWAAVDAHTEFWNNVARQLTSGAMPPRQATPLPDADRSRIIAWIEDLPVRGLCEQIASDETERWHMGTVHARHLTRLEFRNAVRDLLGVVLAEDQLPPADGAGGEGFDTSAGTLFTSVSHLESWMQSVGIAVDEALSVEGLRKPAALATLPEVLSVDDVIGILQDFAAIAWRHKLTPEELQLIIDFVNRESATESATREIVRLGLNWCLLSPKFLFITEHPPAHAGDYQLSGPELATRLSLFLWSSVPDHELLELAQTERLKTPTILRQQIQRMLSSDKSLALGTGFGLQWLNLQRLQELQKSTQQFSDYTQQIRSLQQHEAELFVSDVLRNNRPLTDLFISSEIWANRTLADFYGLPADQFTEQFRRYDAAPVPRSGAATLGAVLATTSYPTRTSPVLRGKWILEQFLGEDVPPPPDSVPVLDEQSDGSTGTQVISAQTLRNRMLIHRADEECAACHQTMDQLGFCLESFDPVGRPRQLDGGLPIDDTAELADGTQIRGAAGLQQWIMQNQQAVCRQFSRRLLGYALGRPVDSFDECVLDAALRKLEANNFQSGVLIEQIVLSYPFQHRYSAGSGPKSPPAAEN